MKTTTIAKNWVIGTTPSVLDNIHKKEVNITIYNRDTMLLEKEANKLLERNIKFKSNGDINTILSEIAKAIEPNEFHLLLNDIKNLLHTFNKITNAKSLQLLLATVNTNMCRRFHTDVNDLRMLCTYVGFGTLWLTEDNINRKALNTYKDNEFIVMDKNKIQQAESGSVLILKGEKYQKRTKNAVVHRSPTIENGEKRLLLRIDTNEF